MAFSCTSGSKSSQWRGRCAIGKAALQYILSMRCQHTVFSEINFGVKLTYRGKSANLGLWMMSVGTATRPGLGHVLSIFSYAFDLAYVPPNKVTKTYYYK
jgi:hypothetical protein